MANVERDLSGHSFELQPLEGMAGWFHLVMHTPDGVVRVLADYHEPCGSMRHHVEQSPTGDTLHTCLDCALAQAKAEGER